MDDEYVQRVQLLLAEHPAIFMIAFLVAIVVLVTRIFGTAAR